MDLVAGIIAIGWIDGERGRVLLLFIQCFVAAADGYMLGEDKNAQRRLPIRKQSRNNNNNKLSYGFDSFAATAEQFILNSK